MADSFSKERHLAELAVQRAVLVTKRVLELASKGEQTKRDRTSVSLADFAAQALLVSAIHHAFPNDQIVGEEDASILYADPELATQVWELVRSTHLEDADCEAQLHTPGALEAMLAAIDLGGRGIGGSQERVWFVDPVDGTRGFLEGGQYVVCAALVVNGVEKVAAFGCPLVDLDAGMIPEGHTSTNGPGYLLSAVRGQGVQLRPLSQGGLEPPRTLAQLRSVEGMHVLRFCENIKSTSPQFPDRHRIAAELGTSWDPIHIYSTQLRYISLALGFSDIMLRVRLPGDPPEHIWDHAGGIMLFEEVGGRVTDLAGKRLVLTTGRDLSENFGLIAAPAVIDDRVVGTVKKVLSEYPQYAELVQ